MKCPKCDADLVKQTRHGIEVDYCANDHGMCWTLRSWTSLRMRHSRRRREGYFDFFKYGFKFQMSKMQYTLEAI